MFTASHDPAPASPLLSVGLCANLLDALAEAPGAEAALARIDAYRRLLAGPGIFSIQLNVTTRDDPGNEIRLQRLYSSASGEFPVQGRKRKTLTPWTETLFLRGQVFVAEGSEALERTFDDYAQMRPLGLNAVVNVPMMAGPLCYATFNVFGTRGGWQPSEVLALRVLALAAARWVSPAPDLAYSLKAG
ncbi:MAG: GAF domain-containing protein [Rubrivivax sp.]